ncbi:SRPBCC family protein [Streptomyces roseicoloratus]|uniref:SRPBCC family protein n=1 Tax=Streptomyces roseicoloratus TaxID=2508722 RepID=A0ABY9RPP1_9ACTN|nr:SRPBCC family protein [Streptomyces roseicoloratus]WMX43733.1 SRPBCC family protein [Streptomyces roseicoloratus]
MVDDRKASRRDAEDGADDTRTSSGDSGTQKLLDRNPGANHLAEEFESYVQARLERALNGVGDRIGGAAEKVGAAHLGPRALLHGAGGAGRKLVEHMAPGKGSFASKAAHAAGTALHAKDVLVDKMTPGGSDEPRSSAADSGRKNLTIIEDIDVGVPVQEAYNQWTQFQEFSRFAKGVVSVDQEDETTTQWQVKVAKSNRAYKATVTEQIPDERIAWTAEGAKGTTRGVVTFHSLGENLTKVLLVMEYYPKGIVEKTGSLVRAQGRRARLDLKAFRTFVMMKGEATGSWRGEIQGGKVVAGPDEESDGGEDADTDTDTDESAEGEEDGSGYEGEARDDEAEDDLEDEDEDDEDAYEYEAGEQPAEEDEEYAEDAEDAEDDDEEDDEDEEEAPGEDEYDDEDEDDGEAEDEEPRARRSRKG